MLSFIFLPIFMLAAHADLTAGWVETPAFAPNVKVMIYREAPSSGETPSAIVVQRHSLSEEKVMALMARLKTQDVVSYLSPHHCYQLRPTDLRSQQTWCEKKDGSVLTFIEMGSRRLSENAFTDLAFHYLQDAK